MSSHARRGDPWTSHASGAPFDDIVPVWPESDTHKALRPYGSAGPLALDPTTGWMIGGLTAIEIQELIGGGFDKKDTLRKRVSDLLQMDLIRRTGFVRPNCRTGKDPCNINAITGRGRAALRRLNAGIPWYGDLSLLDIDETLAGEWWGEIRRRRREERKKDKDT